MDHSRDAIAFFNNKGGVGKTTLACNYAHYASVSLNLKVAVIDLDPQANATQLLLTDQQWDEIYEDPGRSKELTILRAFDHILQGDATINSDLKIHESERFKVDVIAGHPSLSRVEDLLSASWVDFKGEIAGGARRTNWLSTLRDSLDYDIVVLDLGPSLGALNRSALLGATHFVTPVAADLFSLYALENIGTWASSWLEDYKTAMARTKAANRGLEALDALPDEPHIESGYVGYTVQQYVAKRTGGELRPTAAYDKYRALIPARAAELKRFTPSELSDLALGVVPNMFSMVPLAQSAHAPIMALEPKDGVRGAQVSQRERYVEDLSDIFHRIAENMGYEL